MKSWSKHPVIYEINAWVWLQELRDKCDRRCDIRKHAAGGVGLHRRLCASTPCG